MEKAERIDFSLRKSSRLRPTVSSCSLGDKKVDPNTSSFHPSPSFSAPSWFTVKMNRNPDPTPELHDTSEADVKSKENYLEKLETGGLATWSTHIAGDAANLSQEHRDYLLKRHGTLELDPMPGFGDADPLNWATWKVNIDDRKFCPYML